jgi:DNA-binding response OmpR family regulator
MKADILVIEDIKEMSDLIDLFLSREGLSVTCVESAEEALQRLEGSPVDLIVLDINLPGMDGFEFLHLSRKTCTCPVLIVSARDSDEDIITGLGYGADEFVTKPFSPRVLVARVRALLRRSRGGSEPPDGTVRFGPFVLDEDAFVLKRNGERVPLSVKEFGVLSFLASHEGTPQAPQEIYDTVWKNRFGDLTAVAVYVQRLRKKIEDDPANPVYIETVYGRGYRFTSDPSRSPTAGTAS